jgi:serine/threonine protein kinase
MATSEASALMTVLTTPDQFLDCVRKSGLVDDARLVEFQEEMAGRGDEAPGPEQLAERLIQEGLLTYFQAQQLLRWRWQGFVLGGKYRILELLGSGGMGRVFLCEHMHLHTPLAVKVLPPEKTADTAALERFHREARAAATLSHPNLVRAFDIDRDGDFSFIVMEYVRGQDLQRLVEQGGPFAVARAVACIRQAARGLQHFFEHDLVHRDIKPGNILLDQEGTIKILDMGLARFFCDTQDHLTEEQSGGRILGTADYMAPEQAINSHQATIQADLYSLGATFYFLLAGRPPFAEGSLAAKMLWHQVRNPPPLRSWREDVPAELEAALLRMMAKEPAERFASPAEVIDALERWDRPLPPLKGEELPPLCPAVQRLLSHNWSAGADRPRLLSSSPKSSATPLPADRIVFTPFDRSAENSIDLLGVSSGATPAPSRPPRLESSPTPRRSRQFKRVVWITGLVLLLALFWGGYRLYVQLFPAPAGPAPLPQLDGLNLLAGLNPGSVIPDYLAIGQVGQSRTVRLTVRDRARDKDGTVFLYSALTKDNSGAKVFTVAISQAALTAFKREGIADPYVFYMGQTIDVKGTVRYLTDGFNRPGIEAREPAQIRLVNPE